MILIIVCLVLSAFLFIAFWIAVTDLEDDIEDLKQLGQDQKVEKDAE